MTGFFKRHRPSQQLVE
ncbi:MAG: hypothetical protein EBR42_05775 [Betaproteobacteria bacterium]|nr:hypothetical protein [Betaproteobacteria bacterium]